MAMIRALIVVVLLTVLMGCARVENRQVDPAAFSFWVVPF